jgi:hypothetical protein
MEIINDITNNSIKNINAEIIKIKHIIEELCESEHYYFNILGKRYIYKMRNLNNYIYRTINNSDGLSIFYDNNEEIIYKINDDNSDNNIHKYFKKSKSCVMIKFDNYNNFELLIDDYSLNTDSNIIMITSKNENKLLNEYLYYFLKFNLKYYIEIEKCISVEEIIKISMNIQIPTIEDQQNIINFMNNSNIINEQYVKLINKYYIALKKIEFDHN